MTANVVAVALALLLSTPFPVWAASGPGSPAPPGLPDGSELVHQRVVTACPTETSQVLVLGYAYRLPDGGTRIEFKVPNQPARVVLLFKEAPGEGGVPYAVYQDGKLIPLADLPGHPCDIFSKAPPVGV